MWRQYQNQQIHKVVAYGSVLFFSRRDPRVGHAMDVLSQFISVHCHSDWLFHGKSCPRLDVVHPGRAWSSSFACTWHCSLHYLFLQATPHGVLASLRWPCLTVSSLLQLCDSSAFNLHPVFFKNRVYGTFWLVSSWVQSFTHLCIYSTDFPDCLPILLSISVFSLYSSCSPLLVFLAVD